MLPRINGPENVVALDAGYLERVLENVTDVAELKVCLFVSVLAGRSDRLGVRVDDLLAPHIARAIAPAVSPEPAAQRVRRAVERAVVDGLLFRVETADQSSTRVQLFPATPELAPLYRRLSSGLRDADKVFGVDNQEDVSVYRPNIFALYERHLGPLTPIIAEQLRDADTTYPRDWIEAAMLTAVDYNKRNWRYVQAILARWERSGGPDGVAGQHS